MKRALIVLGLLISALCLPICIAVVEGMDEPEPKCGSMDPSTADPHSATKHQETL